MLLPALLFRLLVPAGFMPGLDEGFSLTMQMCHGDGTTSIVVRYDGNGAPLDSEPGEPTGRAGHEAPCVFATSGVVAPPPADLQKAQTPRSITPPPPPIVVRAARKSYRDQSARAPPLSA